MSNDLTLDFGIISVTKSMPALSSLRKGFDVNAKPLLTSADIFALFNTSSPKQVLKPHCYLFKPGCSEQTIRISLTADVLAAFFATIMRWAVYYNVVLKCISGLFCQDNAQAMYYNVVLKCTSSLFCPENAGNLY